MARVEKVEQFGQQEEILKRGSSGVSGYARSNSTRYVYLTFGSS